MLGVRLAVTAASTAVAAAAGGAAGGTDYAGIAAVITSISGVIATIGAIYLGSRRRGASDTAEAALKLLLEMQKKDTKPPHAAEEPDAEPAEDPPGEEG